MVPARSATSQSALRRFGVKKKKLRDFAFRLRKRRPRESAKSMKLSKNA